MSNCRSFFVTATGTDVGKTYISALIVKALRDSGINCGYYKPVLSGAIKQKDGSLLPGDADYVVKTSGLNISSRDCVTYCFEEAVSPHLAASRSGVKIELDEIKKRYNSLLEDYDTLIVEGAGGITCPFCLGKEKLLLSDVIKALDIDVVLVADAGLGTINYVLLTYEYAKALGINIIGVVYNNYEPDNFMHVDNVKQIEKLTGLKTLAKVKKGDKDIEFLTEVLI
jgi:dethiobiotin synthetase